MASSVRLDGPPIEGLENLVTGMEEGRIRVVKKWWGLHTADLTQKTINLLIEFIRQGSGVPKPRKSPTDYHILVVDNSHAYIYIGAEYRKVEMNISDKGEVSYYWGPRRLSVTPQPPNIPVINDGNFYRDMIIKSLKAEGYNVEEAPEGLRQAISMLSSKLYDLVFLGIEIKPNRKEIPTQEAAKSLLKHIIGQHRGTELVVMPYREEVMPYPDFISNAPASRNVLPPIEKPFSEERLIAYLRVIPNVYPNGNH